MLVYLLDIFDILGEKNTIYKNFKFYEIILTNPSILLSNRGYKIEILRNFKDFKVFYIKNYNLHHFSSVKYGYIININPAMSVRLHYIF